MDEKSLKDLEWILKEEQDRLTENNCLEAAMAVQSVRYAFMKMSLLKTEPEEELK